MHFILGIIFTSLVIADRAIKVAMTDEILQCFNDYVNSMVCQLTTDQSDCTRYNMSLTLVGWKDVYVCTFREKNSSSGVSECGCLIDNLSFVVMEIYTANLYHSGNHVTSKNISVTDSMKPKTPTIQEVKPTESRNFWVIWKTNYENGVPGKMFSAQLSYRKKRENIEVSQNVSSTEIEVDGRKFEPSTTYALKIRTYSDLSCLFSDWSEEFEFTTSALPPDVLKIAIVSTCLAVVILTSALFWYGVRLKANLWDNIPKCSNPEFMYMVPGVPKVLDPPKVPISTFYVDCLDIDMPEGKACRTSPLTLDVSSERDSELDQSSSQDYSKTYLCSPGPANVQVVSHLCSSDYDPLHLTNESGGSCLSSSYNNMTYFSSGPVHRPDLLKPSESSPLSTQPLHLDPSQRPVEADVFKHLHPELFLGSGQPDLNLSTNGAPILQTDFSYHSCDGAISGSLTTMSAEDAGLAGFSFDDSNTSAHQNVTGVTDGFSTLSEAVSKDSERGTDATMDMSLLPTVLQDVDSGETLIYDMNPCYNPGRTLPPSDESYQVLQSLGPNGLDPLVLGQGAEDGKLLNKSLTEIPQSSTDDKPSNVIPNSQEEPCLTLGNHLLTSFGTDQAMRMQNDISYHVV